jgi:hypothetical protein
VSEIALRRQGLPFGGLDLDRRGSDRGQTAWSRSANSGIAASRGVSIADTVLTGPGRKGVLR